MRTKWYFPILITMTVLLAAAPAHARRAVGTLASSSYGQAGPNPNWIYAAPAQVTINGVTVGTETVCQGGVTQNVPPPNTCSTFVFLYQIPSGPNNLVLTFSGLSNFTFSNSGFGVLTCDPSPVDNMLCSQNLSAQQINSLGWDTQDGDLIITVPSVPTGDTLTFYIAEPAAFNGLVASPTLNVGGAEVVPTTMNFGSADVGTAGAAQTLTIANSGDFSNALNVSDIAISNGFTVAGSCAALNPGENCALSVAPAPTAQGTLAGTINFTDNSPVANESAGVNGNGSTGNIGLSPSAMFFGPEAVGAASQPITLTITNPQTNAQPLAISGVTFTANPSTSENDFVEGNSTCGNPVAPGSNCTIQIIFSPTIAGVVESTMTIADNSAGGSHVIPLEGSGVVLDTAVPSPATLLFAAQANGSTSSSQTITVKNAQTTALTVEAVTATAAFGVASDNCSTAGALSANATCTVSVNFQPNAAGAFTGTLTIADDAFGGTLVIPLSGTGLETAAATPTFSVPAGTYHSAQTIAISDSTAGATIYYTADGTTPTTGSTVYSNALTVSATETIQAIATASGYTTSPVASATYTITYPAATPTFSPAAGTYTSAQNVAIADSTPGATIYYTTDGTTPGTGSAVYSAPIAVSSSQTLMAVATATGYATSAVASAQYTINLTPPGFAITGTAVSVAAGTTTSNTSTISIAPAGGFTGSVTLSATVSSSPAGAVDVPMVGFSSGNPVTINATGPANATLTITTTAATSSANVLQGIPRSAQRAAGILIVGAIVCFGMPLRRRRATLRFFLMFLVFTWGVVACGGGMPQTPSNPGTTPGQYVVTITGTSGSLTATGTVSLTVH